MASNSEVVMLESSKKFVEVTWNDPVAVKIHFLLRTAKNWLEEALAKIHDTLSTH